jgi:hypothetical protein
LPKTAVTKLVGRPRRFHGEENDTREETKPRRRKERKGVAFALFVMNDLLTASEGQAAG